MTGRPSLRDAVLSLLARQARTDRAVEEMALKLIEVSDGLADLHRRLPADGTVPPGFMTVGQAAFATGFSEWTIRRRCSAGTLPAVLEGGRWLIEAEACTIARVRGQGRRAKV